MAGPTAPAGSRPRRSPAISASPPRPRARCSAASSPTASSTMPRAATCSLTDAGRAAADGDLPPPRAARVAADLGRRARLGRIRRRGDASPGRDLAAGRGPARRDARPSRDLPARQPDRRRDRATPPGRARRSARSRPARRATIYRITEEAEEDAGLLVLPRGAGLTPGRRRHDPRPVRVARFADARWSARPRDARSPARRRSSACCRARRIPRCSTRVPATATASLALDCSLPTPVASGSPRAPPARSTSGRRGRRCSTTSTPGTPAARSSSASRTPTRRAARSRSRRDILDGLHWLGLTLGRGPGGRPARRRRGPFAPYRQMQRLPLVRRGRRAPPRAPTWPIPATARPRSSTPTGRPRKRPSSRRATSAAARD